MVHVLRFRVESLEIHISGLGVVGLWFDIEGLGFAV